MLTRVSEALVRGAVLVQPDCTSFDEIVVSLIDAVTAAGGLPDELRQRAAGQVREREAIASTAMVEINVSIPHTRMDGLEQITAAIAVSPNAVYEVTDGLPISIVVLVLTPSDLVNEHLEFLSALSLLLQSPQLRRQLQHAGTADEVLRAIRENERDGV
jgi:mannitol/fructose-specific phosphotransferase system IIA component (Ntr-type)